MEEVIEINDSKDNSDDDSYEPCKEAILLDVEKYSPLDLEELLIKLIPVSWGKLLYLYKLEIGAVGLTLSRLVTRKGHVIVPHPWNVFRALNLTPWPMIKVVIIGQDPYYLTEGSEPAATGCCFECKPGMPIRRSLETIFMRLDRTVEGFEMPKNGDLTAWALQGVLLLNTALTTNKDVAYAHAGVWKFLPIRIMQFLAKVQKNVVYMLWGRHAQKFKEYVDESENLVLEASHPAARGSYNTFMKCNHFNEANEYLVKKKVQPIDWRL